MIQEAFLHFVWKNQYFNKTDLFTSSGEPITIQKTGFHNHLAGPDFKEAHVVIGGIKWAGAVEIHLKSSDWYQHKHEGNPNYDNVILHVVYEHDKEVLDDHKKPLPTLVLKGLIKPKMLNRYNAMIQNGDPIPCADQLQSTKVITRLSMLERALIGRIEDKARSVTELLEANNSDWEETAYQWLSKGLGFKTNSVSMLDLARLVPSKVLFKHNQLMHYEALLFGASGLLSVDVIDPYLKTLKSEYDYLSTKYGLSHELRYNQWHFSGVRPSNFPTVRIAQLAALMFNHQNIFSLFTEFEDPKGLIKQLQVTQSSYWQEHLVIDKKSKTKIGGLTKSAKENLLINTTVPLLVAYAKYKDNSEPLDKALNLLMALSKEENKITRLWNAIGWNVSSAFDSQGLIELHNTFCKHKRCIECTIGAELIKA
ncbi:DUF2851 family protein [Roseivirga sp. E12]|uniref:DUF2851 family protein n=1 Tax=Roseivirga sp. E12 TaxID=2819237 RepID=UPI001ABC9362|nr:DUF2851 family protein [Roseivirga sp. E12]MBO3697829.1 DUF2851 family protein [Roseivirga sp. E12]